MKNKTNTLKTTFTWKLRNFLFRLTHPSFWIQRCAVSWEYDLQLKRVLDSNPTVVHVSAYTFKFKGSENLTIWGANYPYAYGCVEPDMGLLPSPLTRKRLLACRCASLLLPSEPAPIS